MNVMMSNSSNNDPFADYLWMGDEMDNFDQQCEAQFEDEIKEEEFIKSCIEQLLDEEEEQTVYFSSGSKNGEKETNELLFDPQVHYQNTNQQVPNMNGMGNGMVQQMTQQMQSLYIPNNKPPQQNGNYNFQHYNNTDHVNRPVHSKPLMDSSIVSKSKLNPNAQPFSFNPNAQVFVPKGFTTRPTKMAYEQASHTKPMQRFPHGSR